MIDYHSHILPGLDDGAVSIDDSVAMAKGLAEAGYHTVFCTPHCIKGYYEHSAHKVREATLMLQVDLDNAGVTLELRPGMEYILDECFADFAAHLQPLGDSRLLLCEAPPQANPGIIAESLELIIAKGLIPLVAHPERSQNFYEILTARGSGSVVRGQAEDFSAEVPAYVPQSSSRQPFWKRLLKLRKAPDFAHNSKLSIQNSKFSGDELPRRCLFQANLGSFTGFYPGRTQQRAYDLLKAGALHCLASDLHNSHMAGKVLKDGIDKLDANPLLMELARRPPDRLEEISDAAAQQGEQEDQVAEQRGFEF